MPRALIVKSITSTFQGLWLWFWISQQKESISPFLGSRISCFPLCLLYFCFILIILLSLHIQKPTGVVFLCVETVKHLSRPFDRCFSGAQWPLPRGQGGGGTQFSRWGWLNGSKNQIAKKSLHQKLTPKKSNAEFSSLKNFQKALLKLIELC